MSGKGLLTASLIAVTTLLTSAFGQKNEIAVGVGRTFIANQGIKAGAIPLLNNTVHFGNGLSFELNYARHLAGNPIYRLDAEVPFIGNPDENLASGNGGVPSQYSAYFLAPSARVKLVPDNVFQPWVSIGGGYGRFNMNRTLVYGGANPGPSTKNSGVVEGGVGLDVRTFKWAGIRLAARDFWSGALPLNVNTGKTRQHNMVVTGGLVFKF
ncbi:MAG: hypothetical protein DMG69_15730 [Acidobacteria bacterium]|nr:MAG: hypothetical protein DMG69_15730 [Acidobacteriota bacterium]